MHSSTENTARDFYYYLNLIQAYSFAFIPFLALFCVNYQYLEAPLNINKQQLITQWVNAYSKEMLQWARNRVPQKEIAEDLVQDTFVVAFQKLDSFEERSQPKTWLFAILKFKIADYFRASFKMETRPLQDNTFFNDTDSWNGSEWPTKWAIEDEGNLLDNLDFKATLDQCQDQLPKGWNHALVLKYFSEKDANEICKEMGITTTNYWQMVHRAKLQLRKCLDFSWFKK